MPHAGSRAHRREEAFEDHQALAVLIVDLALELDDELAAMRQLSKLLAGHSVEARGRILRYLLDRWETTDVVCAERNGHTVAGAPSRSTGSQETPPAEEGAA